MINLPLDTTFSALADPTRRAILARLALGETSVTEPRAIKDIDDWLEHYRRFFDESFDRLDGYLRTLQAKDTKDKKKDEKRGSEK